MYLTKDSYSQYMKILYKPKIKRQITIFKKGKNFEQSKKGIKITNMYT